MCPVAVPQQLFVRPQIFCCLSYRSQKSSRVFWFHFAAGGNKWELSTIYSLYSKCINLAFLLPNFPTCMQFSAFIVFLFAEIWRHNFFDIETNKKCVFAMGSRRPQKCVWLCFLVAQKAENLCAKLVCVCKFSCKTRKMLLHFFVCPANQIQFFYFQLTAKMFI